MASLAIHAAFFLLLVIVASVPHRFHFDQTAIIELQGMPAGMKGSGSAPKTATLKTKTRTIQERLSTDAKAERVSLKHGKKIAEPQPDLKERILQRLQQTTNITRRSGADPASPATNSPAASAIGTDVPFPFAGYLAEVQNRITDLWEQPSWLSVQNRGPKVVIVFRIHRDGTLAKVVLAVPSGVTAFDKSAVQAVEAANPLPPLPLEFKNEFLDVHLQFDLTH